MDQNSPVTIVVDAEGGDKGCGVVLEGCEQALAADDALSIILVGKEADITQFAASHERVVAHPATQVINMGDHPTNAVREKKDSSIVVGCQLVKSGDAQGFFSAGSTGACLVAATLFMGRVKGVLRPAMGAILPFPDKSVILVDCGANADCKPEYLLQFGQMGAEYAKLELGVETPLSALINNGSEDTKGSELAQQAFELLSRNLPDFMGNAEGGDVPACLYDVYITDGFTGNVLLKGIEGTVYMLYAKLKAMMMSSAKTKFGALLLKDDLKSLMGRVNGESYGGAPLLGVKGAVVIGHGSSKPGAIASGIEQAARAVRCDLQGAIEQAVSKPVKTAPAAAHKATKPAE